MRRAGSLTATEAASEIAGGDMSRPKTMPARCLERIEAIDGTVKAFAHLDPDEALSQARALDERRRNGQPIGPLHGIPVAIKDIFDTADYPTECGSPLAQGRRPLRDATVVARLRAAGAVIIGKTVTTEFAYFHPGPTRNPHDPERTPGGSSSGSAAAVAAGMVPLAIGTQTNGSVIRPASYCGVLRLQAEPRHDLARTACCTLSRALDHVGVFARTLADIALILDVIAGLRSGTIRDTRPVAAPAFLDTLAERPPLPPQFAFVRTPVWDKADADDARGVRGAGRAARRRGRERRPAGPLCRGLGRPSRHHGRRHGAQSRRRGRARRRCVKQDLRDFLAEGSKVTAVRYLAARDRRAALRGGPCRNFQGIRRHHHAGGDRRRAQGLRRPAIRPSARCGR